MPDRTPQNIRTLQIRLNQSQYDELFEEATREDRSMSSVARRRMFTPGSEVPIESKPDVMTVRLRAAEPTVERTTVPDEGVYSVDDNPFGDAEATEGAAPPQESAIASDVATAQITRPADRLNAKAALTKTVKTTKPKADDFEKTRRPGEYSREEMADINAERLARMKTGTSGSHKRPK